MLIIALALLCVVLLGVLFGVLYRQRAVVNSIANTETCRAKSRTKYCAFMEEKLKLNNEQVGAFRYQIDKLHQANDSIGKFIRDVSTEIMREALSDSCDIHKLNLLTARYGELQVVQRQELVKHYQALKIILTPDQIKVLIRSTKHNEHRNEGREHWRKARGSKHQGRRD